MMFQTKRKLSIAHKFKLAFSNFMERKWRNMMIALATSIGFIGIIISFGLGTGIVNLINQETGNGKLPAQVQITLNNEVAGSSVLNQEDIAYIQKTVGKDKIKYLEAPFGLMIKSFSLGDKNLDLSTSYPNYAQMISLFKDSSISVSANDKKQIMAGQAYKDSSEKGITLPVTAIDDFNKANQTKYRAEDLVGKPISLDLVENRQDGPHVVTVKTTIRRILKDEMADSNSYMSAQQMEGIIKDNQLSKSTPYFILELKDSSQTEAVAEKLKKNKKYTVMSQQEILSMVITFIRVIQGLLIVMSSQAILVSIVMIGVIVYINIMQRSKEIGVMKTVGYHNKDVKAIFVTEALIITMVSLFISFIVAIGVGSLANVIVAYQFPNISQVFALDSVVVFSMLCLALFVGVVSAYFPTLKISKLDPVESLRYE